MGNLAKRHVFSGTLLDVGSYHVETDTVGTYRDVLPPTVIYTGLDMRAGPNVDIVAEPYRFDIPDGSYDVVISGQCFEHVEYPWMLIAEMARVCVPGGLVVVIAPYKWRVHKYPLDCWRFLPDGMTALFKWAKLQVLECETLGTDTHGVARKEG